MALVMIFIYYVIFCAIGISVLNVMMFGNGTEYVDRLAGPGFAAFSFIFVTLVAPILALLTNAIISKLFKRQSKPILLEEDKIIPEEDRFRTLNERIIALAIDGIIVFTPIAAIDIIHFHNGIFYFSSIPEYLLWTMVLFFHLYYIPAFALYSIVSLLIFNRTIGKKMLNLVVINTSSSQKITFRQVALRNSIALILTIECAINVIATKLNVQQMHFTISMCINQLVAILIVIDVVVAFRSKNNSSLHDKISQTACVRS